MDQADQALAYALADFAEPHDAFVAEFGVRFPGYAPRKVIDLGCGTADVTLRFARAYPHCELWGVDGAPAMLAHAHAAVAGAGLGARIHLAQLTLPSTLLAAQSFDTVICNSLLHHLRDPGTLWQTIAQVACPGATWMVMDLRRPASPKAARRLVQEYASDAPPVLRRDFYYSLLAAYTLNEVRTQLARSPLTDFEVETPSDRHCLVWGRIAV